jgi:hypothetical protein
VIVGNLGSKQRADVGTGGSVRLTGGIDIEWWVKASDRWQTPSTEISLRDSLLAFAPVLKTSLRVPGGDVVTHVYATVQGQRELVAFDVSNQSSAPVAIGFVVRSLNGAAVELDGSTVRVGSRPVLFLPSSPVDRFSGAPTDGDESTNTATFVIPLLHRASLRAAALLGVSSAVAAAATPVLSALPDPDMVARGWALQAGEVARVDGDDVRNGQLRALATATLLHADPIRSSSLRGDELAARSDLARALIAIGAHDDAHALMSNVEEVQGRKGELGPIDEPGITASAIAAVVAVGRHMVDPTFGAAMVPMLSGALEFLHRNVKTHAAVVESHGAVFLLASRLFERVDEGRAAANSRDAWNRLGARWPLARASEPLLPAVGRGATLLPPDLPRTVNAVIDATDALVSEQNDGSLELFSGWTTPSLLGARVAMHHASSPFGKVSVAIRWHGERPALLWEVAAAPADEVVLRCSVLDPQWSTTAHSGEALLGIPAQ